MVNEFLTLAPGGLNQAREAASERWGLWWTAANLCGLRYVDKAQAEGGGRGPRLVGVDEVEETVGCVQQGRGQARRGVASMVICNGGHTVDEDTKQVRFCGLRMNSCRWP